MKKINLETCSLDDVSAAGLEDNLFANPLAFESYVWENACRIFSDWQKAQKKIEGISEMTHEAVEEYILNLADQIFASFWEVEDDE